ncbi:guanylate kinase isoform X11 [Ovis aries]|uniref:guanylate kinase isoform X11 n=1 Tax=Ovis aries TaxID=9940 RepID=UPI001C2EA81D|nr:guanylate kinase isoform X11 [Ovis aries]
MCARAAATAALHAAAPAGRAGSGRPWPGPVGRPKLSTEATQKQAPVLRAGTVMPRSPAGFMRPRDVRTKARCPERTLGGWEEHPTEETPAGAWQHLWLQRVPHDKGPEARRGERQRLLLRDQGGDAARHCCRRLHRARRVLRELVRDQQGRCAGRAGHEPHLRAGRGPAGRAQHQEDGPAAHLHLRAAALTGCPGAAAAAAEHGDGGEPGQAPGSRPGRHGEQK